MSIAAVTGHRPGKLGGYDFSTPKRVWLRDQFRYKLLEINPKSCISGMALGADQDFAYVCIEMNIPFLAAIPFIGQERKWPLSSQEFYKELLKHSYKQVVVSEGGYSISKMQIRNRWMVDNCDILIAVWDGSEGGTGNCVAYAKRIKKDIIFINPR